MRRIVGVSGLAVSLALALLAPAAVQAQQPGGYADTGTHIKPSDPSKDVSRPISREKLDKAVAEQFAASDINRDGIVTLDEFNASVETRKAEMIRQRFARIDSDRNQAISMAEFSAWQRSMGSVVLSSRQDVAAETLVPDELPIDLGRTRDDQVLEHLLRPLSATVIVEANADYDTGVSLAELTDFQRQAFDAGDLNKDQWLTWDEVDLLEEKWGERLPAGPEAPPAGN